MTSTFFISLAVLLIIDFFWLGVVAKNFYNQQLSAFSRTLNWPAAILTYLLLVTAINFLALPKASGNPAQAFLWGSLTGLIIYGVYDLTNLATLADWSLKMTIVDILWGTMLCGAVSFLTTLIIGHFKI